MAGKRTLKAAKKKPSKPSSTKKTVKKALSKKAAPKKAAPKKPAKKVAPKTPQLKKAAAKKPAKAPPAKPSKKAAPPPPKPSAKAALPPEKSASAKAPASKPILAKGLSASLGATAKKPSGMLPPRASTPGASAATSQRAIVSSRSQGETLTLVPARSSSSGLRPRQEPALSAGRKGSKTPTSAAARREGVTLLRRTSERPSQSPAANIPIPVRKVEAIPTLEERFTRIEKRLEGLDEATRKLYYFLFDQAWVSHDSALEGTVYMREELEAGFSAEQMLTDSSLQPAADEIRRHREAIEYVRDFGQKKKLPITVDVIKKIFLILHPSEGDLKTVRYRKDIPQHRLYFHEYAAPDKIIYKVRQIVDWANAPDTKKSRSTLRLAARVHYDLLRVFPFQTDSGKVARLFMNLLLYRGGYPPAIIHAKERQSYYEALKGEPNKILKIVQDSVEDGLASIEKLLDEQYANRRRGGQSVL